MQFNSPGEAHQACAAVRGRPRSRTVGSTRGSNNWEEYDVGGGPQESQAH